jgi:uncharacterized protein (DUF4415 family)
MKKKYSVDPDDAAPLTGEELRRPEGEWRIAGKVVSAEEGKAAFRKAWKRKIRTNIHFDSDVIAHYKSLAGDRGYQTLINAAARRDMDGSNLKIELLQVMKVEFFEPVMAKLEAIDKKLTQLTSPANVTTAGSGLALTWLNSVLRPATGRLQLTEEDNSLAVSADAVTSANTVLELRTPIQGHA